MRLTERFLVAAEQLWLSLERARLKRRGELRLARGLSAQPTEILDAIEQQRAELLRDNSPLDDASLGPAGIYDQGVSIAEACEVSKPAHAARLLYSLAAEFRPSTTIELGTNVGISSAYLAAAGTKVTTFDVSPYRQRVAQRLHESLGLRMDYVLGLFSDTLADALERGPPVEMAFIDGHHQYRPTLDYFEMIAEKARPGCVFIFDDIRWSAGMKKAWSELRASPKFDAVADLGRMGVGVYRRA